MLKEKISKLGYAPDNWELLREILDVLAKEEKAEIKEVKKVKK